VQIIGADPEGSVYSGGTGRPYLVEGVGEDFWPTTYDKGSATASSRCPTASRST
jgi:cystathionine beta-synthase